jgi:hypothetical protein
MIAAEKLDVTYYRENQHILARVNTGEETLEFRFGRNNSLSHIHSQIPRLVADQNFDEMIRGRYNGQTEIQSVYCT